MSHYDTEGVGERSDMPIVCETCLGPNPYVRMQRIEYGGQCHVSGRPYTVFRWKPGPDARYKKTIICQEVAKAKNVCQVCLLDLNYSLPVQVRDQALGIDAEDDMPQSNVGQEYALKEKEDAGTLGAVYEDAKPNDLLQRLHRPEPYYERNKARLCTFFLRGECKRGSECPYRHEKPKDDNEGWGLSRQNIKDRYYGINDPVANKMLSRVAAYEKPAPPADTSITTIWIGGLPLGTQAQTLRDKLYMYGEISNVHIVDAKKCAFVTFATREAAERAMDEVALTFVLDGQRCKVHWGKPQEKPAGDGGVGGGGAPVVGGAGPGPGGSYYPAMDAQQMGSVVFNGADKREATGAAGQGAPAAKRPRA